MPDGYELVWGDEFDGDTLDESKWRIYGRRTGQRAGGKVQLIANEQTVTVHDGLVTSGISKPMTAPGSTAPMH